jgi:hypothetical protein
MHFTMQCAGRHKQRLMGRNAAALLAILAYIVLVNYKKFY